MFSAFALFSALHCFSSASFDGIDAAMTAEFESTVGCRQPQVCEATRDLRLSSSTVFSSLLTAGLVPCPSVSLDINYSCVKIVED